MTLSNVNKCFPLRVVNSYLIVWFVERVSWSQ